MGSKLANLYNNMGRYILICMLLSLAMQLLCWILLIFVFHLKRLSPERKSLSLGAVPTPWLVWGQH